MLFPGGLCAECRAWCAQAWASATARENAAAHVQRPQRTSATSCPVSRSNLSSPFFCASRSRTSLASCRRRSSCSTGAELANRLRMCARKGRDGTCHLLAERVTLGMQRRCFAFERVRLRVARASSLLKVSTQTISVLPFAPLPTRSAQTQFTADPPPLNAVSAARTAAVFAMSSSACTVCSLDSVSASWSRTAIS